MTNFETGLSSAVASRFFSLALGVFLFGVGLSCDVYPGPEAPNQGVFVGDVGVLDAYDRCYEEQLDVSTFFYSSVLRLDQFSNEGGNSFACQSYPALVVPEQIKVDVPSFGLLTGLGCCVGGNTFLVSGALEQDAFAEVSQAAQFWTSISPSELVLSTLSDPTPGLLDSQVRASAGVSLQSPDLKGHTSTYFWPSGPQGNIVTVVQVYAGNGPNSGYNHLFGWDAYSSYGEAHNLQHIVQHELGHAVGIRGHHTGSASDLMDASLFVGETITVSAATTDAVKFLYNPIISQRPTPIDQPP